MHVSTHLDVDLVALETTDEVNLMLELQAPPQDTAAARPPHTVVAVLDRSGSMDGRPLEACTAALALLVDRLDPADRFGLVTFDHRAAVVVPTEPVSTRGKAWVRARIAEVTSGGTTDLSAGLVLGLMEARRAGGDAGATVMLVSDGHANSGETSADRLAGVAASRATTGITTTTIGFGLGYDEVLLAAVARGGGGDHVMAADVDAAGAAIAATVGDLLSTTTVGASLTIRPLVSNVASIGVWHDLPSTTTDDGVVVQLGDLYADEQRKVLVRIVVPALARLGLATVAELVLRWTSLPDLVEHCVTLPVSVNVVPADVAAGRVPDPTVTAEQLIQQAQWVKKAATEAMRRGETATSVRSYLEASRTLREAMPVLPPTAREALAEEAAELDRLAHLASTTDPETSVKSTYQSMSARSRSRLPRQDRGPRRDGTGSE